MVKQKFYSDVLDKYFDTEEACVKAELKEKAEREEALAVKQQEEMKAKESANKKAAAKLIEQKDAELNKAYNDLEVARREADKVMQEARKKSQEILSKAKRDVDNAYKAKYDAISKFNKEFGVYTVTLTGDKALNEMKRFEDHFNNLRPFTNIFDFLF